MYVHGYWNLHPERWCTHSQSPMQYTTHTDPATAGNVDGFAETYLGDSSAGLCKARVMAVPGW